MVYSVCRICILLDGEIMNNMTRRERERLVREEEIIDAAVKLFGQKGFDIASMDEIALEAQFTKRTLYLYFENKEELFFAAAFKGFKKLLAFLEKASEDEQTGFAKLVQGSKGYYRFYKEFPETLRLIGEIGQVKKRAGEGSQRLKKLLQIDNELFQWAARSIQEGINDGSILEDLNAVKATFSIIFMMTGFFNQLSVTGETFMEFTALEPEDFCNYSMELLFNSIKKKI
jgi:AcrR family transcriptional regulator